ncbi:MAG: peptidoglycan DD-metalloendopeptidase family protein [Trueperaceae bacterium]
MRVALLVLALLLALALSSARRDVTPPELYWEMGERVPAAKPFELFVSASEPVTYLVSYGELELERVSQDLTVSLLALAGRNDVTVLAVDAAGNEVSLQRTVLGVPVVMPTLHAVAEVGAGDPVTVVARWSSEAAVTDASLQLIGAPGAVLPGEDSLRLIAAIPLGNPDALWPLEAQLVDEFGRLSSAHGQLRIVAGRHDVEELNVAATTLSVITPAGRDLEREAFELAYADWLTEPQWSEPFLLPIEGRSTSGFGLPRRYAPGGPVSYHLGSDIGAPTGTPILATNDGVVRIADFFPIKGGLTIIDHGAGVSSLYFHQSRILIEPGTKVTRGQPIGEVGSTGLSTGPHLHWEMRVAEVPTNPMAWVDRTWP